MRGMQAMGRAKYLGRRADAAGGEATLEARLAELMALMRRVREAAARVSELEREVCDQAPVSQTAQRA